jgi:hypothetical protein
LEQYSIPEDAAFEQVNDKAVHGQLYLIVGFVFAGEAAR